MIRRVNPVAAAASSRILLPLRLLSPPHIFPHRRPSDRLRDVTLPNRVCETQSASAVSLPGSTRGCFVVRSLLLQRFLVFVAPSVSLSPPHVKCISNYSRKDYRRSSVGSSVGVKLDKDVVRFSIGEHPENSGPIEEMKKQKRKKMSRKAKLNELRFYRLKARKKMKSPNPEVRILYKLGKAKRKEQWLIEKLRKFEIPKAVSEPYDPEILTEEEKFYLKRTGEKKKHYVPVGRRGVFGGVVLNMHLHWKNHETVKVVCKPCKPGQIHAYAEELARLSKGIVIDIKPNNIIIFYRGKNYVRPEVMSPPDTLSKAKALEKYKYEQSLEHTSQFVERLENELEEFYEHRARYKKDGGCSTKDSVVKGDGKS